MSSKKEEPKEEKKIISQELLEHLIALAKESETND